MRANSKPPPEVVVADYDTLQKQISEFTGIDMDKIILSKYIVALIL